MYFVLPKPFQNSPKTTSADTAIFPCHQQPPFTSKNSHHVVPFISTRCTKNNSQTILKTTPFFPKNSTYRNNHETLQKRCKKTPRQRHRRRRRRPPPSPPPRAAAATAAPSSSLLPLLVHYG